ncbi:amidohydrolase family protein [Actinomadura rubrisoli]|uniref:Amidohydrolase-related domain-containing protein n=1 Tax=Actinomadura rubrisoli TaxID=2530368 RepID=A0A4R5BIU6_9ACTN|nr:amidohydrolase family protein [Actinomadura rubrisoli]TDD85026.1 hypothetical protein E1298_19135 [Actinomadura rubrisoli]
MTTSGADRAEAAGGLPDCDTHFTDDTIDLWHGISAELSLPVLPEVVDHEGRPRLRIGDRLFPKPRGKGQGNPRGLGHLIGPGATDDRREFMARHGIRAAVLQPGFVGLSVQAVVDGTLRRDLLMAYNLLARRACAGSPLDLRWAVLLSAEDPEWSLQAVERFAADDLVVGAVVRPTARTSADRLSGKEFTPVLQALARERLALFVHGGTGCYQWSPLADAYEDYTFTHAFGHMGEHMIALTDLLTRGDGLPDGLRVVMLESGTSWVPSLLERLDSHVRRLSGGGERPSGLFAEHVAIVPDPEERHARWACEVIGGGNVLFGSDYPHWDTVAAADWLGRFGDLVPPAALEANTRRFVPRLAR